MAVLAVHFNPLARGGFHLVFPAEPGELRKLRASLRDWLDERDVGAADPKRTRSRDRGGVLERDRARLPGRAAGEVKVEIEEVAGSHAHGHRSRPRPLPLAVEAASPTGAEEPHSCATSRSTSPRLDAHGHDRHAFGCRRRPRIGMSDQLLSIRDRAIERTLIVRLSGEIDLSNAHELQRQLEDAPPRLGPGR